MRRAVKTKSSRARSARPPFVPGSEGRFYMLVGVQMHHFDNDRMSEIGAEGVLDPFGLRCAVGVFGHGDYIEAQRPAAIVGVLA